MKRYDYKKRIYIIDENSLSYIIDCITKRKESDLYQITKKETNLILFTDLSNEKERGYSLIASYHNKYYYIRFFSESDINKNYGSIDNLVDEFEGNFDCLMLENFIKENYLNVN